MAPSYPSIQSFYKREVQKPAVGEQGAESSAAGAIKNVSDGFTEEELTEALDPLTRKWNPEREYEELTIEQLSSGPRAVNFVGRVVNFSTIYGRNPKQPKATGWHYLIVKDDTSCISVKLYFANKPYPLKFGQLLSIWTAFIADATKAEYSITSLTANMFPGRCTSDHIMLHTVTATFDTSSAHRRPLSYTHGAPLPDLMTLKSYLTSGHDGVASVKILVCVKSIGARKKFNKKNGGECEMIEVVLFDHTGDIKLKVWQENVDSVRDWIPGETILLISNPGFKVEFSGKGSIGIQMRTILEVDPEFPDAEWLRKYAVGLTKQESLGMVFPEGVWDVEACEKGVNRILFTLADVDEWVRSSPHPLLTGYLSLILTDLSLVLLRTRNMLHCTTCCGIPIYSNKPQIPCPHCSNPLNLVLNPKIVGKCIDETGCITAGKLLWSDTAWKDLFGRNVDEIPLMTAEEVRLWEQRCKWLRVHVVFGWSEDVGRLAVLRVKM